MSHILHRSTNVQLIKRVVKGAHCSPAVSYSRKSNAKSLESPYKVEKTKVRLEDGGDYLFCEGGPNWELLAPRGNRFYFPNRIGPAWQEDTTTVQFGNIIESLVDFEQKEKTKLEGSILKCPVLIKNSLHELFPAPEVVSSEELTLITLKHSASKEHEQGASKFVIAAREICFRLRINGFWADFMNPFSGKPFYSYVSGKNLYKIDERFRGLGMKLEKKNNCLVISTDDENCFSGSIFTNAAGGATVMRLLLSE